MIIKETKDMQVIAKLNEPVHTLHHKLYPNIFKPYSYSQMYKYFISIVDFKDQHFMICEEDGEAIGYVWFQEVFRVDSAFRYSDNYIYINQISVNKEHRAKGAGKLLFDRVLNFAKDNNINRIGLDYWAKNTGAKAIYDKLGFEVEKEVAFLRL